MTAVTIGHAAREPITIDVDRLIESRLLVTASSGGGKSWLLRKILEQVSAKTQTIVLDKEGEFASLREKRDMVLAGPNGEVPADVRSSGLLCRRLMEMNLSAVIDISELKPSDQRDFVSRFCNTLVELPRALWRPCVVCIDETHELAPEGEKSTSSDAVALLGSKGRKRGYCLLAATQRLSKLSKDVAAECRNQFIGLMNLDVDLKRAADMLGFPKDRWQELRDLSPPGREGEFFCFGPALNVRQVTKMRSAAVETTHPKAGQGRLSKPPEPSAKISGVLGELKDLAKKADEEAKTLADAKREISDLKRQLAAKPKPAADEKAIERAVSSAVTARDREWQKALKERDGIIGDFKGRIEKAVKILHVNGEALPSQAGPSPQNTSGETRGGGSVTAPSPRPKAGVLTNASTHRAKSPEAAPAYNPGSSASADRTGDLPRGEAAILSALIQFPDGLQRTQLTVLTGYKRSSRDAYIQRLREKGYVEARGDSVQATEDGIAALPDAEPLPTGEELRDYWLRRLPEGERAILEQLIEAYPEAVQREALDEATGYKRSSRDAYLQRMRAKQLIEEPSRGEVRASENLF
jgi:hypothetical protein